MLDAPVGDEPVEQLARQRSDRGRVGRHRAGGEPPGDEGAQLVVAGRVHGDDHRIGRTGLAFEGDPVAGEERTGRVEGADHVLEA